MVAAAVTADPARGAVAGWTGVVLRSVLSAAAGAVLYLSFPPRPLWFLAIVAFALLGAALRGRRARAGLGYGCLFGLAFLLPLLSWTGVFVGWPWLFLPAAETVFVAVTAAGMAVVSRLPAAPLLAAAVWVAGEAARARIPFGGFPWGRVAFGQPDGPYLPLAALGGAPLLSFAVVLTGLALAELIRAAAVRHTFARTQQPSGPAERKPDWRRVHAQRFREAGRKPVWRSKAWFGPALAAVLPLAVALLAGLSVDPTPQAGTRAVALVQGNVPRAGLDFNAQRRAVLDNHAERTEELAADVRAGLQPHPDLVLWPENAADIDPIRNADATAVVDRAVADVGVPVLLGAILNPPTGGPQNAVVQWEPGRGPVAQYVKRHVQPFGEYIPLRPIARWFSSDVDRVSRDLQPGNEVGVLDAAGTRVGIATCYEVAFDGIVRDTVTHGGTVLAVPTNNATFGYTEMTYQQLAMSRVRAVEHSRAVLVAATSGVSAVITPDGRVQQRTGLFTADALVADVPLRTTATLATRLGAAPEWLVVAIAVAALLAAAGRTRRSRGTETERPGGPEV
jgi:apolipoprotein N-acyltransferase